MKNRIYKIIISCFFLFCLCLSLSGCIRNEVSVNLKANGGTVTYSYAMSETLIDTVFNGVLPKSMEGYSEIIVDNEIYYTKVETFKAKSNKELEAYMKELSLFGEKGVFLFSNVNIQPYYIKLVNNTNIFSEEVIKKAEALNVDINKLIYVNITVKMPSKVTEYSNGYILPDGKTVSYSFEELTEQTSLEIRSKNTAVDIFIISAVSLILALLSLIVIIIIKYIEKKKEKEAERMPATPIDKISK